MAMRRSGLWLATCLLLIVGCQESQFSQPTQTQRVPIVATTSIIADAVRQVGGEHVRVVALMPAGSDPHNYTPQAQDAETLAEARLILSNGLHLEGKIGDLLRKPNPGQRTAEVSKNLKPEQLRQVDANEIDPHIWFDVKLWMNCVETIRDELCAIDPTHADDYRANTKRYLAELQKLDDEVRAKANSLPADRRVLVTSHDAFGYFAKAYGFEVHGLQGVSTAANTGTADVGTIAGIIGSRGVRAIFCETSVPTQGLEKVLETVRKQYPNHGSIRLVKGEDALYSDSLGPAGSRGETYVGMVRHNIQILCQFLNP
jgi:manganese/zinc/iron transport system substrate-binding protein